MKPSAEEVIRARIATAKAQGVAFNQFETEYRTILAEEIPRALEGLERADWKDATLEIVDTLDDKTSPPELAIWRLTPTMYLTSNGLLAIKVVDPRGQLSYDFAEVNILYLVKHHSHRLTLNKLHYELKKLAESEPSDVPSNS